MRQRSVLSCSTVLLTFACSSGALPDGSAPADLQAQQEHWRAARLESYRFDFQQQCFCVREQVQAVTIEVRDGRVARVTSRETGQDLTAVEGLRWYTVADLFQVIAEAQQQQIAPLTVRYDPELGYPTHIEAGSLAADAGVIYDVSNLQRLP